MVWSFKLSFRQLYYEEYLFYTDLNRLPKRKNKEPDDGKQQSRSREALKTKAFSALSFLLRVANESPVIVMITGLFFCSIRPAFNRCF